MKKITLLLSLLFISTFAYAQNEQEDPEPTWAEQYADDQEIKDVHLDGALDEPVDSEALQEISESDLLRMQEMEMEVEDD